VRRIIGQRTRREFSIGDRARIILDRADPLERKLQFSIVEPVRRKQKKKL
jgi:ribonuclease R